jgi:hypothetical protein
LDVEEPATDIHSEAVVREKQARLGAIELGVVGHRRSVKREARDVRVR